MLERIYLKGAVCQDHLGNHGLDKASCLFLLEGSHKIQTDLQWVRLVIKIMLAGYSSGRKSNTHTGTSNKLGDRQAAMRTGEKKEKASSPASWKQKHICQQSFFLMAKRRRLPTCIIIKAVYKIKTLQNHWRKKWRRNLEMTFYP